MMVRASRDTEAWGETEVVQVSQTLWDPGTVKRRIRRGFLWKRPLQLGLSGMCRSLVETRRERH